MQFLWQLNGFIQGVGNPILLETLVRIGIHADLLSFAVAFGTYIDYLINGNILGHSDRP